MVRSCKKLTLDRSSLPHFRVTRFPVHFPIINLYLKRFSFFLEDRNYQTLEFFMSMNIFVPELLMSAFLFLHSPLLFGVHLLMQHAFGTYHVIVLLLMCAKSLPMSLFFFNNSILFSNKVSNSRCQPDVFKNYYLL